jgi:plasmid stability protein
MADILIRKVNDETKEILKRRAERRGKNLEADLRDTLEKIAREEADAPDDTVPFGTWLVAISRPGVDLDDALVALRAAPLRPAKFD